MSATPKNLRITWFCAILAGFLALLTPQLSLGFSCAGNFRAWTRDQVLQNPLDFYERLERRPDVKTLGDLQVIRNDLQETRADVIRILGAEAKLWTQRADQLRAKDIPYGELLDFYAELTLKLQDHLQTAATQEELGFKPTNLPDIQQNMQAVQKRKPGHHAALFLPLRGDLSQADFVRTNAVPLFYLGITTKPKTMADGLALGPADFFFHDILHTEWNAMILEQTLHAYSRENALLKIREWNAAAIQILNPQNEAVLFFQMHEIGGGGVIKDSSSLIAPNFPSLQPQ